MKRFWILAMLMIALAGCGGSAAPSGGQCNQELCVRIEVAESIHWGEPVTVVVTVTPETDIPELGVSIYTFPSLIIVEGPLGWETTSRNGMVWEGGAGWVTEARTNQSVTFVRKIRFPAKEGLYEIQANASTPQGLRAVDSVRIYLTREGGRAYYSGTPVPTSPLSGFATGRSGISQDVECFPGPCLTIRVVEPVRWGEPVQVLLQVEGKKQESVYSLPSGAIAVPADFPQLGLTFSSPDPSVQIKPERGEFKEQRLWPAGNGVWWVADVWAKSAQEYTFLVTLPQKEGAYSLHAAAFDLKWGEVSGDWVQIELGQQGGKVFAPSLGTPFPTVTPWPTPFPTPTFPPPERTPTTMPYPYPVVSPQSPSPMPTQGAYP